MPHLEPPDFVDRLGLEVMIEIDYTNHRGERRWRKIIPETGSLLFGETPDHKPAQWCFSAWDVEKQARRTFAILNVHGVRSAAAKEPAR